MNKFWKWLTKPQVITAVAPRLSLDLEIGSGRHYLFVFHPADISRNLIEKMLRDLNKHGISASVLRARGTPAVYDLTPDQLKEVQTHGSRS